jgi:hypothetical protein
MADREFEIGDLKFGEFTDFTDWAIPQGLNQSAQR